MRYRRSHIINGTALILYIYVLLPSTHSIMVPTGKLTPIEPAEPLPRPAPVVPSARRMPAPVHEYTQDNPEPPPLDPSYVPVQFNYIQYLSPHAIVYVPMQIKVPTQQKLETYKSKYDKNGKILSKLLQKYQDYPSNLQKKYIHHYFTHQSDKTQ